MNITLVAFTFFKIECQQIGMVGEKILLVNATSVSVAAIVQNCCGNNFNCYNNKTGLLRIITKCYVRATNEFSPSAPQHSYLVYRMRIYDTQLRR